jgi:molybdopterin molybdotransferase
MMDLDEALELLRSIPSQVRTETISLDHSLGRVLARNVLSPIDSPPFDKSAMDGFAVGIHDDSTEFTIIETAAAGGLPVREVRRGECTRIMTGAMLPQGTGRVIRREYVSEETVRVRVLAPELRDNVIRRGTSIRAGQAVLHPGVIGPQEVGVLAASGIDRITAAVPPRTMVLCTGPEIRPAGAPLGPGQVYDSNGPQLRAQLAAIHCPCAVHTGIDDRPGPLTHAIESGLRACDLLLLTGGVSVGSFDYVPGCVKEVGAEILFHGVAVKPGKPVLFARRGEAFIFGLPGNPVSAFVLFEVFVKPFLYARMGITWTPVLFRGPLASGITRVEADRAEFLPVRVRQGRVEPVTYHGSAHLNALTGADGLIRIEPGVRELAEGTMVDVRPI